MIINDSPLANTITKPILLIQLRLGFETVYLSTGEDADWGDITFKGGEIAPDSITYDGNSFSVGIDNPNYKRTRDALLNRFLGGEIKVWEVSGPTTPAYLPYGYVEQGYEEGSISPTVSFLFEGEITDTPRADHILQVTSTRSRRGTFPRVRINTPLANFTARSGTTISVSGRIYTVTQRGTSR